MASTQTRDAAAQEPVASRLRPEALRGDDGASAVEFALVVPLLLVIVFGIIDFGVVFGQSLSLNNAARDAARYSVVRQIDGSPSRSCYDTLARTRAASVGIGLVPDRVGVTVSVNGTTVCSISAGTALPSSANTPALQRAPCAGSVSGTTDQLRVAATYATGLAVPIVGVSTFNLTGNGYFRCEYS